MALGYPGVVALDVDTEDASQLAAIRAAVPASPVAKAGPKGFTAFYWAVPASASLAALCGLPESAIAIC